jgi:hypothetical protein
MSKPKTKRKPATVATAEAKCHSDRRLVGCVVTKQGGPILNEGYVCAAGDNIAAIEIDMKSKRCEVMAESSTEDGAPVIWLDGTNALHLKKGHEKEETEVAFPDYRGWRIFSANVCRYTFRLCFVRDESPYK